MERYNKIKQIGSGTFGQAWLVESTVSRRMYALKELGVTSMSDQDRHLALNEAKILSKLKHKNIVRYKEAFVAQGRLCIAMEFAEKGDLYTRIKERNGLYFPEVQILEWFTQLCLSLKYIHGQNILHRDLKTQNIFLGKDDIIKLGDFGIARMLNNTLDHAQTTVGTPYYLSPEICQRKPYNHKSDMWSLGCVLYEMATLKHAFNANNFSALVIKILQGQYPPIPRCYGPLLEDLVSVLLQKDPENRPSAKQLLYVPAMQPYVKRFLQCERDRTDSVASDISNISSRSGADCSQVSSHCKTEKERDHVNTVKNFSASKQDVGVKQNSSVPMVTARDSSSRERRISSNKTTQEQEKRDVSERVPEQRKPSCVTQKQEKRRVSESAPKQQGPFCVTAEKGPKSREPDSFMKARENLLAKCPTDKRKQSLLALAHAQHRRHSEQTSVHAQPGSRIPKGRIHSHGARGRDISEIEDDVFAVDYPTVVSTRKPDVNYDVYAREIKRRVSNASASQCSSRCNSVIEEKKPKPAMSVCQPKCNEGMRTTTRRQSAVTSADDENSWSNVQKHRRLTSRSEIKRDDKENGYYSHVHAQVTTRRRVSSGALKQIQTSCAENQLTVKTGPVTTGNESEIRKRTYTVSQERRASVFEIPEVDEQKNCEDGNGSCKGQNGSCIGRKASCKDANGGKVRSESERSKSGKRSNQPDGKQIDSCERKCDRVDHASETTATKNKRTVLPPSCKFTFCGKTLHLNVSSHDSIYSHMEALRMYLEKELGTRLLTAVYRYVTNTSLEEHERIKQTVTAMLGDDKMTYFPVLLQLVACEAIYFH